MEVALTLLALLLAGCSPQVDQALGAHAPRKEAAPAPDGDDTGGAVDTGTTDELVADSGPTDDPGGQSDDTRSGDPDAPGTSGPVGHTWRLDLASAHVSPASIGPLLSAYVEDYLLVEVIGADDAALSFRLGWSDGFTSRQDTCAPTVDVTGDATPSFATGPTDASIWALQEVRAEDAWLAGTLSPEGDALADVTFSALADTRTLSSRLGSDDPDAFCELVAGLGERCEPCADGAPTCMRFTFAHMSGHDLSPLPLDEVARPCP